MNEKKYFKELRQVFKNDPYQDRFLQELKDHSEDMQKDQKNISSGDTLKKYFGEPKEIKKTFNKIVRPREILFMILEGFFYGLLMLPTAFIGGQIFYIMSTDGAFNLPITLGFFSLWFVIYFLAFKSYLKFHFYLRRTLIFWLILIAGPSLSHIVLYFWDMTHSGFNLYPHLEYISTQEVGSGGAYLILINFLAGILAWFLQSYGTKRKRIKNQSKWKSFLKKSVMIYLLLFLILRTIGSYFDLFPLFGMADNWLKILYIPFGPAYFIEFIFWFFLSMLSGSVKQPNLFLGFYFQVIFLSFLAIQSLIYIIYKKDWRSYRLLILIYVLSLILINPKPFELHPEYQVSYVPISRIIEHEQSSIFYPFLKYKNQDEGYFFRYRIGSKRLSSEVFYLTQNTGKTFSIDLNSIDSIEKNQNLWKSEIESSSLLKSENALKNKELENQLTCQKRKFIQLETVGNQINMKQGVVFFQDSYGVNRRFQEKKIAHRIHTDIPAV